MPLPAIVEQLVRDRNLGVVVTRRADGTAHPTPVWIDTDGELVMFNTATSRAKYRHLRRDPWVAVTVMPSDEPQSGFVTVYGRAVEFDEETAESHIHELARKYIGQERYPDEWRAPDERRVLVKIRPERYDGFGIGAEVAGTTG